MLTAWHLPTDLRGGGSWPKTGAYSVDVESFERVALPTLVHSPGTVVVIDEIGRMELHSHAFKEAVQELLNNPECTVFGAITAPIYGHRVPFCDFVTSHDCVSVLRLKKSTRTKVTAEYLLELKSMLGRNSPVAERAADFYRNHDRGKPSKRMRKRKKPS